MLYATPLSVDSKIFLLAITGLRMPATGSIRNRAHSLEICYMISIVLTTCSRWVAPIKQNGIEECLSSGTMLALSG